MTTGSLGQGISSAVGIAKALKIEELPNRVYTIIGDGELDEGQCYEALMFANHHKLDNLIVFIDENKLQLDGYTVDILDHKDIKQKIASFGFNTVKIDGHDEDAIREAIENAMNVKGIPSCIVLDTIKAKGVSIFEGDLGNHHIRFSDKDNVILDQVIAELEEDLKWVYKY